MSFLDEGPRDGEVVVMLHGNPSWSYYWRKLVLGLSRSLPLHRAGPRRHGPVGQAGRRSLRLHAAVARRRRRSAAGEARRHRPGHAGGARLGRDDRLRLGAVACGAGEAAGHPNTGAFPLPAAKPLPWQLALGRDWTFGALVIRAFNAFSSGASFIGVEKPMPPAVRRAYVAPYDSWANRIATVRFVQDIPLSPGDRAWPLLEAAGKRLPEFADRPAFIGWGLKDFVFDRHFLDGFRAALPQAEVHAFEDANHYVLEDKADVLVPAIRAVPRHATRSTRTRASASVGRAGQSAGVSGGRPCARRALSHCALAAPIPTTPATSRHAVGRCEWMRAGAAHADVRVQRVAARLLRPRPAHGDPVAHRGVRSVRPASRRPSARLGFGPVQADAEGGAAGAAGRGRDGASEFADRWSGKAMRIVAGRMPPQLRRQ